MTGSIKLVFQALGWLCGGDGDRALDFSFNVNALGVQLGVEHMHDRKVLIDNTSGRENDLLQWLDEVISSGKLNRHDALKLRGKVQFAAGQFQEGLLGSR